MHAFQEKQCTRCGETRPLSAFYKRRINGYLSRCRDCTIAESAEVRAKVLSERRPLPAPDTRDQGRSRRVRDVRAVTISVKRLSKADLEAGRREFPEDTSEGRPKTRADCKGGARPCVYVSCPFNLYLDVSEKTGAIKLNFPDIEPEEMTESCALDVADKGGVTLEESAQVLNLTRERIRQLETKALAKVQAHAQLTGLRDWHEDEGRKTVRRLPLINTRFLDEPEVEECEEAAE